MVSVRIHASYIEYYHNLYVPVLRVLGNGWFGAKRRRTGRHATSPTGCIHRGHGVLAFHYLFGLFPKCLEYKLCAEVKPKSKLYPEFHCVVRAIMRP